MSVLEYINISMAGARSYNAGLVFQTVLPNSANHSQPESSQKTCVRNQISYLTGWGPECGDSGGNSLLRGSVQLHQFKPTHRLLPQPGSQFEVSVSTKKNNVRTMKKWHLLQAGRVLLELLLVSSQKNPLLSNDFSRKQSMHQVGIPVHF